jgi:hypothetical protein
VESYFPYLPVVYNSRSAELESHFVQHERESGKGSDERVTRYNKDKTDSDDSGGKYTSEKSVESQTWTPIM